MAHLSSEEVARWLLGVVPAVPREAVAALVNSIRHTGMDGAAFGRLVASRATPALGEELKPAHMAVLRRCWNAKFTASEGQHVQGGVRADASGAGDQLQDAPAAFSPAPRLSRHRHRPEGWAHETSSGLGAQAPPQARARTPPPPQAPRGSAERAAEGFGRTRGERGRRDWEQVHRLRSD